MTATDISKHLKECADPRRATVLALQLIAEQIGQVVNAIDSMNLQLADAIDCLRQIKCHLAVKK